MDHTTRERTRNMNKPITRTPLAILAVASSLAFTPVDHEGLNATYGVPESDPSQIELSLRSDLTFTYQDLSVADAPVLVHGTYAISRNKVRLQATDTDVRFHDTWTVRENGMKATSRKGLAFYTLRRTSDR